MNHQTVPNVYRQTTDPKCSFVFLPAYLNDKGEVLCTRPGHDPTNAGSISGLVKHCPFLLRS